MSGTMAWNLTEGTWPWGGWRARRTSTCTIGVKGSLPLPGDSTPPLQSQSSPRPYIKIGMGDGEGGGESPIGGGGFLPMTPTGNRESQEWGKSGPEALANIQIIKIKGLKTLLDL